MVYVVRRMSEPEVELVYSLCQRRRCTMSVCSSASKCVCCERN